LLKRKDEWNIRIVLNLLVPNTSEIGSMKKTKNDPWVKVFNASIEAGLLVIAANGNSKAHNNLHPLQFFAIGGYEDCGTSDPSFHKPHPSVPVGWNADGYLRPDILAPFTWLPVPCVNKENHSDISFSFFGGSCGSAAIIAGLSAYLLSSYPELDVKDLRDILSTSGKPLSEDIPVIKLDAGRAWEMVQQGIKPVRPAYMPSDIVDQAIEINEMIDRNMISRNELLNLLSNPSPILRKVVIYGLGEPRNTLERMMYWNEFMNAPEGSGEKILWLNHLFRSTDASELDKWMSLLSDKSIDVIIFLNLYLEKFYPHAPKLVVSPFGVEDLELDDIRKWFEKL
jgi:serine protease AprX